MEKSNPKPLSGQITDAKTAGVSDWFYTQRGDVYGPVSAADLCAAAHLGFIGPEDLVRRGDKSDWVFARAIPGLFARGS